MKTARLVRPRSWLGALFVVAATIGCSGGASDDDDGGGGAGGTDSVPLEIQPALFTEEKQPLLVLSEGADAPLWRATQGGHVMLVGARIRNSRSDTLDIRTRLRNPDDNALYAEESRTFVAKPVPDMPELIESDIRSRSQVSHLALCPNYETRSIIEEPWLLEVVITELYESPPRTGTATLTITPACEDDDPLALARCECECAPGYVLGKCN